MPVVEIKEEQKCYSDRNVVFVPPVVSDSPRPAVISADHIFTLRLRDRSFHCVLCIVDFYLHVPETALRALYLFILSVLTDSSASPRLYAPARALRLVVFNRRNRICSEKSQQTRTDPARSS